MTVLWSIMWIGQAYFLDMLLIYEDPKSAEKLSFSL